MQNTKKNDEFDIVVAGSGPAGIAAAISAGRKGEKVLLLEQFGTIGGVSTSGLMSHWTGSVDSALYYEVLKRACQEEGRAFDENAHIINTEYLELTYYKLLQEANVTIRLYSFVSDVLMEDNALKEICVQSKSGKEWVKGKVFIDSTGDGDVAALCGIPFIKGRETDGKMQPATLMFSVAGVDTDRAVYLGCFEDQYQTERGELQELAKNILPYPAGHVLLYRSTMPGVVICNMTNCIDVDGTNAEDLTKAELVCRMQIPAIIKFLREYVDGYENCYLHRTASAIGIRETRHMEGMYTLTEEDVYKAKKFDDWVVRGAKFTFDVHNITGAGLDKTGLQKGYSQTQGYTIPYRSLVPKKVDNLLYAGRCISGTHLAHSNYRAMPICLAIGEAAGIAAAISVRQTVKVRDVNVKNIQSYLDETAN